MRKKRGVLISFRWTVFAVIFLCGFVSIVIVGSILLSIYSKKIILSRVIELQNETQVLVNKLASGAYLSDGDDALDTEIDQASGIYECRVLIIDESFRVIRDTQDLDEGKIMISEKVMSCFNGNYINEIDNDIRLLLIYQPVTDAETGEVKGCITVHADLTRWYDIASSMHSNAYVIYGIAAVILALISLIFSTVFSRPFTKLASQIETFDKKEAGSVFALSSYRETDRVAELLNEMDRKVRAEIEERQKFVSNVSHELKTPIAAIRVLTDSLLEQEDVPNEIYRDFVKDISFEVERESQIIEDLLSIVWLEKSGSALNIDRTDMNEFLETLLRRLNPIAAKANVELVFESFRPVSAEIDEIKFSQAISNIIENAIKYNREGGFIHVTLNADHRFMYVTVADNGIGIPKEAQSHIFDRFYRAEQSRSRQYGGTGLGLSISQSIIFLHNGDIKFESEEGEGTTFTIRIPLIYTMT